MADGLCRTARATTANDDVDACLPVTSSAASGSSGMTTPAGSTAFGLTSGNIS